MGQGLGKGLRQGAAQPGEDFPLDPPRQIRAGPTWGEEELRYASAALLRHGPNLPVHGEYGKQTESRGVFFVGLKRILCGSERRPGQSPGSEGTGGASRSSVIDRRRLALALGFSGSSGSDPALPEIS